MFIPPPAPHAFSNSSGLSADCIIWRFCSTSTRSAAHQYLQRLDGDVMPVLRQAQDLLVFFGQGFKFDRSFRHLGSHITRILGEHHVYLLLIG